MEQNRFDDVTRKIAESDDRRSLIKRLAAAALGLALAGRGLETEAVGRRKKNGWPAGHPCRHNIQCKVRHVCRLEEDGVKRCVRKGSGSVSPTPPPPPPPGGTCRVDEKCDPKGPKNQCGDPYTCKCERVQWGGNPKDVRHVCKAVETCRRTYWECKTGAKPGSLHACCSGADYCKPTGNGYGFCKPKVTCPPPTHCYKNGVREGDDCSPAGAKDRQCVCTKKPLNGKADWRCVFNDGYKEAPASA